MANFHHSEITRRKVSPPNRLRKIPDVCGTMGIVCIDDFELWRVLDFRIA
ncbi:MAG TPA: hypothetical protein VK727_18970 [Steroidobacteraceae bacterium]|jgi:hypothetical protein|nr:hypothetical protein [Steroidobacteraceae bacterium]